MLDKEFQYFLDHQAELVEKHRGRILLIKGQELVGTFDNYIDAYREGKEKYGLGNFLLQECLPGQLAYTNTIYSPVF